MTRRSCSRCGRSFLPLADVAAVVGRARRDLDKNYRLVLPDSVPHALDLASEVLNCISGTCSAYEVDS
jgi:hypothetical protein